MNIETELTDSLWLGSQTFRSRGWEEKERQAKKGEKGELHLERKNHEKR